jgi:hypothetical protein
MNTRQFLVWAFLPMAGLLTCPAIALGNWYSMQTSNFKDRTKLQETISNYAENNTDIDEIAVTPAGEWVIIAGAVVVASDSFPAFTLQKIKQYQRFLGGGCRRSSLAELGAAASGGT